MKDLFILTGGAFRKGSQFNRIIGWEGRAIFNTRRTGVFIRWAGTRIRSCEFWYDYRRARICGCCFGGFVGLYPTSSLK